MALTFHIDTDAGAIASTQVAGWLYLASLPARDTTLDDWLLPASQYARTKITSAGLLVAESNVGGGGSATLNTGAALSAGLWYWLAQVYYYEHISNKLRVENQLWLAGSLIVNLNQVMGNGAALGASCTYGFGETLSGSGYDNFPSTGKRDVVVIINDGSTMGPQLSDYSNASAQAIFNCRQTVGGVASLADTSGHGNDILAGSLVINPTGPF